MGILGNILNKVFHHKSAAAAPASPPPAVDPGAVANSAPTDPATAPAVPTPVAVDVGAVLEAMAAMKEDNGGNYRTSIVDLLKLLDLDSSLGSRKELAAELNVHAGADGSAEQNIALHRAVIDQLVANGGVVPDSMRQ